jgi:hypothetical protein
MVLKKKTHLWLVMFLDQPTDTASLLGDYLPLYHFYYEQGYAIQ